ncbi:hypothetical protein [Tianweitania sediminis]|jgi:hypothetical protein|uniref:DUF945 domain-containing protein n=1 Tax=Tianweitania sediminis TaxID=1502156 RepID=A0A8J7RIJ6_9HYPH|nr:hypothetical protein [Tianweitania sediminis]MBP0439061.1 hypothetical protein [Tianweitania sediminis]HEV7415676.1 hypothetical protein [Tianweitania sediminis]
MIGTRTMARLLWAPSLLLLLPLGAAQAADLQRLGESLKAAASAQDMTLEWSDLTGNDASATLNNVVLRFESVDDPVEVGTVTLTDISEEADHFLIGEARLPDYNVTEEGVSVSASGISVNGLEVPFATSAEREAGLLLYDRAGLDSVSITQDGTQLFELSGLNVTLTKPESEDDPLEFSGTANSFSADLSKVEDVRTKAVLDQLGLQTISGDFNVAGSWNLQSGRLVVDQYDLKVENAGTLGITSDLSGYTPAFIKSLRETSEKMANAPEDQQSAQSLAMLGLMQQLSFNRASIRFEDEGLTRKILEMIASQQNTTADSLANQAKAIVPFALAQLNMPDFASSVSQAVNAFLDDPQNIEITAAPATGVPFAQIMATAMSTPQALIKQLGVSVTANE